MRAVRLRSFSLVVLLTLILAGNAQAQRGIRWGVSVRVPIDSSSTVEREEPVYEPMSVEGQRAWDNTITWIVALMVGIPAVYLVIAGVKRVCERGAKKKKAEEREVQHLRREIRRHQREETRQAELCSSKGERYTKVFRAQGYLAAELDDVAHTRGLTIGNQLRFKDKGVIVAVTEDASHLIVVGRTSPGTKTKVVPSEEIVAVEVLTDIRESTTTVGGTVSFTDFDSGLVIGGGTSQTVSRTELHGVWLKVLIHDVKEPWIVFAMPDIGTAEKWRGILMLLVHRGKQPATANAPAPIGTPEGEELFPLQAKATATNTPGVREKQQPVLDEYGLIPLPAGRP